MYGDIACTDRVNMHGGALVSSFAYSSGHDMGWSTASQTITQDLGASWCIEGLLVAALQLLIKK